MPNLVQPEEVERSVRAAFANQPDGRELRLRDVMANDGQVLVYFDGHGNDHDGPFAAKLPHPRMVGDKIWRAYEESDSLDEWCTYGVLIPILEEYLTGRAEGRGMRDGRYWWLDLSD